MTSHDVKLSNTIERFGERLPMFWSFGAAYAIVWYALEAAAFLAVMPLAIWILFLSAAIAIHLITLLVQLVVRRPRPRRHATQSYRLWIHTYSFPSAHASASFGCAVLGSVASSVYAPQYALVLLVVNILVALYVSFSRIAVGVHFLSDVLAGALLGGVSGVLFAFAL